MTREECGCVNDIDETSGILRCVEKCALHQSWVSLHSPHSREHYESMGIMTGGIPRCAHYVRELKFAGIDLPHTDRKNDVALEVGCGCSMYAPYLMQLGYTYVGVEPEPWAAAWTRTAYWATVYQTTLDEYLDTYQKQHFGLILAAHVVEHLPHAPDAIARMFARLRPGGTICIVVPDDTDKTNPEHWWFFTRSQMQDLLVNMGFGHVKVTQVKFTDHENFIYATARKPL